MKVLILGSEGQIGQYLKEEAVLDGHEVCRFDLTMGEDYDLRTPDNLLLAEKVNWADLVYFLSFDVGGSIYLAEHQFSYKYLDNNVKLMHNTFRALEEFRTPFIFTSSQMSNMTESPYGTLKNLGEHYTRALGGINVRLWNVYGEERDPEKFHVITDFIHAASVGEIHMKTDGKECRQFLYGKDSAQALLRLGESFSDLDPSLNYDITSFEWVTVLEVAELIASLSPGQVKIVPAGRSDTTQVLKNEPTTEILKYWSPATSLSEGIDILMNRLNQ